MVQEVCGACEEQAVCEDSAGEDGYVDACRRRGRYAGVSRRLCEAVVEAGGYYADRDAGGDVVRDRADRWAGVEVGDLVGSAFAWVA